MNNKSLGVIALALFLIVFGVLLVTNITFVAAPVVEGALAIIAGVLILLGR